MYLIVAGLLIGVILGFNLPLELPLLYGRYLSIAVLAALDTAFGGLRGQLEGKFDSVVFVTGFFSNALLAAFFTYIGDRMGVDLYYAALLALGVRVFQNLGIIRRQLIRDWSARRAAGASRVRGEES